MDINSLLSNIGCGVAASAIYDKIKPFLNKPITPSELIELRDQVDNTVSVSGASMKASTIIDALCQNGFLIIEDSTLFAPKSLAFGSMGKNAQAILKSSTTKTDRTSVELGRGCAIQTTGNAFYRQNEDGSISFHVGK